MSDANYTIFNVCNRFPTEDYYCLESYMKSTEKFNRFMVAGIGTQYTGLCDKPKFASRAIKEGLIKTEFIIMCDCWDLVFATTPEEIIEKFLKMECDLVISAERNCFPADLKDEYDKLPATSSFKYLNSGMIVGYTKKFEELLDFMKVEEIPNDYWDGERNVHFNDQFEYQKSFLQQPVHIKLDYQCELSIPLHQVTMEDLDFTGERIMVKETGSYPCTIHLNGSSKTDGLRNPVLQHLNLL